MKVKFFCDSGANMHSRREEVVDLEKDWGITEEEWNDMSEYEKQEMANDWAWNKLEIGFKEL